eukprot:2287911-Alexandrium_andersonii.AAC.1
MEQQKEIDEVMMPKTGMSMRADAPVFSMPEADAALPASRWRNTWRRHFLPDPTQVLALLQAFREEPAEQRVAAPPVAPPP